MQCGSKYTPEPKQHGYPNEMRKQAVQFYVDGMNLRRITRHLGIHHRTVSLWVQASAASIAEVPVPAEIKTAKWMSCSPLSATKKQDLHPHACRSADPLLSGLESRLGAHSTSHSRDGGRGT